MCKSKNLYEVLGGTSRELVEYLNTTRVEFITINEL